MPFKLKLGKSRHQYNVASKSLFVLSIEIFDNSNIECTLTSESLGQECLDNVCQKLGINQIEFFGLQYESRTSCQYRYNSFEWIDLTRPVKKQLDKYAKNMLLHLRVLYFTISGVRLISCEQTRYQYFQQLKHDVLEGYLVCMPATAVQLASYSMQAEFGNYNPERHTIDYLKEFQLFPKTFSGFEILESLTEAAIQQHCQLQGLPSSTAEELYISLCQQLHGYGQETYLCKSQNNQSVTVAVSLTGIRILYDSANIVFYRWLDISNVINYKKYLTIECPNFEGTEQFQFSDMNSAQSVWKMCVLQHKFFMKFEQQWQLENKSPVLFHEQHNINNIHHTNTNINNSNNQSISNLDTFQQDNVLNNNVNGYINILENHDSNLNISRNLQSNNSQYIVPSYRSAPDYETVVKFKKSQSQMVTEAQTNTQSQPDIIQNETSSKDTQLELQKMVNRRLEFIHLYNSQMNRFNSNSTPDLATIHLQSQNRQMPTNSSYVSSTSRENNQFYQIHNKFLNGSSPDLVSSGLNANYLSQLKHFNQKIALMSNRATNNQDGKFTAVRSLSSYLPLTYGTFENLTTVLKEDDEEHGKAFQNDNNHENNVDHNKPDNRGKLIKMSEPIYENIPYSSSSQSNSTRSNDSNSNQRVNSDSTNKIQIENKKESMGYNKTAINNNFNENNMMLNNNQESGLLTKSSNTTKKKLWLLLNAGKLISEKSATLGREKKRNSDTLDNQKHRWSSSGFGKVQNQVISKEMLSEMLEERLNDNQLFLEFDQIEKKKSNSDFSTAQLNENLQLNRFKDVLPYEDNRVRLTPSKDNKYGYVNASHITASIGEKQMFYIAAQGPSNEQQLSVFWQCVWEANVYLIIQLNLETEDMDYLPNSKKTCKEIGQYQVCWEFSQEAGHCRTSKIRLCHVPSRRYRTIWHLKYQNWDENGCPSSLSDYLGFLEEIRYVRLYSIEEIPQGHNRNPPVLVHCTAGVGRTGLTILCDLLLCATNYNQEIDIARTVNLLRHQRAFMVQTFAQYRFVYLLLVNYLQKSRLI